MRATLVGRLVTGWFLAAAALSAGGCSTWPKDVNVRLDESMQPAGGNSVDVHLVAVPRSKVKQFREMPMTDYWSPDGASRSPMPARKEVFLGPGTPSKTIRRNDPVWKQWDAKQRP